MITAKAFKDWLKTQITAPVWFSGVLGDATLEKSITVYSYRGTTPSNKALGNLQSYYTKGFTILIHWNRDSEESELKAVELHDLLSGKSTETIGDTTIKDFRLLSGQPISMGADDRGILEYVINVFLTVSK